MSSTISSIASASGGPKKTLLMGSGLVEEKDSGMTEEGCFGRTRIDTCAGLKRMLASEDNM